MKLPDSLTDCEGCEERRKKLMATARDAFEWIKKQNPRNGGGDRIRPPVHSRGTVEADAKTKKERTR
jgi:hypothetical protein